MFFDGHAHLLIRFSCVCGVCVCVWSLSQKCLFFWYFFVNLLYTLCNTLAFRLKKVENFLTHRIFFEKKNDFFCWVWLEWGWEWMRMMLMNTNDRLSSSLWRNPGETFLILVNMTLFGKNIFVKSDLNEDGNEYEWSSSSPYSLYPGTILHAHHLAMRVYLRKSTGLRSKTGF